MWSDEVSNTCLNFRVILIPKSSRFLYPGFYSITTFPQSKEE